MANNKTTVIVALTAGLAGGLLTRYIAPPAAFAQDQTPLTKEIRAQSFTLVDQFGRTAGTFTAEPGPGTRVQITPNQNPFRRDDGPTITTGLSRIVLKDASGREIWSAGANAKILPLNSYR